MSWALTVTANLTSKCHGPFKITQEVSLVAYQLELPRAWTIHDVFHSSLLSPHKETVEHRAQFQHPPLELIGNEEEYEVEQIINHRYYGKWCQLQYLICWKGYSAADNTWEPADQVHTNDLVKKYHQKHPQSESRYKSTKKAWVRSTTHFTPSCHWLDLQTSPLPLPLASPSTQWTSSKCSQSSHKPGCQWSTGKTTFQFLWRLWWPPMSSVSYPSPTGPHVPLLKDMTPPVESSSSTLPKHWQKLCKRMRTTLGATTSSWRYSSSKERLWQSMRWMQLTLKKPTSTGRPTLIRGLLTGTRKRGGWKGMRKMKDTSQISSSQSLTAITQSMSSPHILSSMACTAWGLWGSVNLSTGMNYSPPMHHHQWRWGIPILVLQLPLWHLNLHHHGQLFKDTKGLGDYSWVPVILSQSGLPGGKRTAGGEEWVHLTPRTGRAV